MKIGSPKRVLLSGGEQRIELRVGDFDLWFEGSPGLDLDLTGEALACALLLPSMASGEDLLIPDQLPLDPGFIANLDQVQEIFLAWQDKLGVSLHRIELICSTRTTSLPTVGEVLSFFSGGVDGTYTALRNKERISTALFLRGIDMQLDNTVLWEDACKSVERLSKHFNLHLATLTTNLRFLGHHHGLGWASVYQGSGLASIGHLLRHKEVLIAATSSLADLEPYGSHPLTDPLFSSSSTRVVHEGAVPRTDKIRAIGTNPVVMSVLRVCWQDSGYNCGKCGKCLRTMVALHLLGIHAPTFPPAIDWNEVGKLRLEDPSQWAFFRALHQLEKENPDPMARRALGKIRRKSLLISGVRDIDTTFGAPLTRLKRSLLKKW